MAARWLLLACLSACGDDGGDPGDGGLDAGRDAGGGDDAGRPDSASDAGPDGSTASDGGDADAGAPARDRLMYVTLGDEARLAVVQLGSDGSMTAMTAMDLALPGDPGPMAYAREARRLYIGLASGSIATVGLDAAGAPSLDGTTEGTGFPVYVALARGESVMVTAYFGADRLRTHDVSGAPPHPELDDAATSDEPHSAIAGPGGRFYVPHRNGDVTQWWDVAADGTLGLAGDLDAEPGSGPRHAAFAPDFRFAYVINEYADSISSHRVNADGSLERIDTVTTLPSGFAGDGNTCADVHVTPDGRFVYGSNRGHDSLAMFAVQGDGTLAELGQVSTETRPREFDVSPDGRFVVAAGQDSGALQSYRVEADGRLTSVDRLDVGANPLWVVID